MTQNRRFRAVLAAAAVLGVGAVGTLALWSDSETLFGQFRSVAFTVESAPAPGAEFVEHESPGEALPLDFEFPVEGLNEETPVDAEVWFRMASETGGVVQVLEPTVEQNDLAGHIDVLVTEGACGESGAVLQQGLLETLVDAPEPLTLSAGTAIGPGPVQGICVEAQLRNKASLPAGNYSTGQVEWEFVVTEEVGAG